MKPEYLCRCPQCHGLGHLCDGVATYGPGGESSYRPATPCALCRGVGYGEFRPVERPDRLNRTVVSDPDVRPAATPTS